MLKTRILLCKSGERLRTLLETYEKKKKCYLCPFGFRINYNRFFIAFTFLMNGAASTLKQYYNRTIVGEKFLLIIGSECLLLIIIFCLCVIFPIIVIKFDFIRCFGGTLSFLFFFFHHRKPSGQIIS